MKIFLLSVTTAALVAASPAGAADLKQRPLKLRETCVTKAERARALRFRASDRVRLIGVELGSGPRGVVLAHQGASNLCIWLPYARSLAARGYRVLVFDHRGFGSSGRASHWRRQNRVDYDVLGAIRVIRARGAKSVVIAGGSLGGAAVLSAAALAPVDGVISLASPSQYGLIDVFGAVAAFRVPALFLAAERDAEFPDVARELYDRCASSDKQLAITPGAVHGIPLLRDSQVRALVDDFIARHSG
ncbi:MAG TPA: alpha/beta fold hydrolase [Gaiellaceae bacterium]|nr:alpha/beta fold hydrolase [Gaiellaceae bacterium]